MTAVSGVSLLITFQQTGHFGVGQTLACTTAVVLVVVLRYSYYCCAWLLVACGGWLGYSCWCGNNLSLQQFMGSWRYLGLPQPGDRHDVMGLTSRGRLPVMLLTMLL